VFSTSTLTNLFYSVLHFCIRQICQLPAGDDDDAYKYFVNVVLSKPPPAAADNTNMNRQHQHAARSYRAMTILKQDLGSAAGSNNANGGQMGYRSQTLPAVLIKSPTQAGLLAKDLLAGLSSSHNNGNDNNNHTEEYSILHIRSLLEALLDAFPEKVLSAAAAGGKEGVQAHLGPLLSCNNSQTNQTSTLLLEILTHLVCFGCTGRKGVASSEKSMQHTSLYHPSHAAAAKITHSQRRKFVKAMADWNLMQRLGESLIMVGGNPRSGSPTTTTATTENSLGAKQKEEETKDSVINNDLVGVGTGEDACEALLTILECVGYPPEDHPTAATTTATPKDPLESVGEEVLLAPLGTLEWSRVLLESLANPALSNETKAAVARTLTQAFALATGNSARICKSPAPATDATEQAEEKLVEEPPEDIIKNRLIDWGLTDKMHVALVTLLPLLIQVLNLPSNNILQYQATHSDESAAALSSLSELETQLPPVELVRHPGRYLTIPLTSWRHQLLFLLKEILIYRGSNNINNNSTNPTSTPPPCVRAMDALMDLPLPPELEKSPRKKSAANTDDTQAQASAAAAAAAVYNPFPALSSFVFAYPQSTMYHNEFFPIFQALVLEHHEPSLRVLLQKAKFVTRAIRILVHDKKKSPLEGILLQCLNLLRLRRDSLGPSCYLRQYLDSHAEWKAFHETLIE
jgi:hypothetical protein